MKLDIYGENVSITEAMQAKIEKKLSFLEKYFVIDESTVAQVRVKVYSYYQKVEVTIPTKVGILRAEVKDKDFYSAMDLAIDKLEDQIRRQKTRLSRRHKEKLAKTFIEEEEFVDPYFEEEDKPVRTKTVKLDRMDLDEAIIKMEMLGHSFFIYQDDETNSPAVVYKRNDGGYGLIETE